MYCQPVLCPKTGRQKHRRLHSERWIVLAAHFGTVSDVNVCCGGVEKMRALENCAAASRTLPLDGSCGISIL